jgi:predicted enzyme related to lactoylglutathione lyase
MPGQIVHVEIPAHDTVAGAGFWRSLFGWEFTAFPGPFDYHMTRISEPTGAAITNMEPDKHGGRTIPRPPQKTAHRPRFAAIPVR